MLYTPRRWHTRCTKRIVLKSSIDIPCIFMKGICKLHGVIHIRTSEKSYSVKGKCNKTQLIFVIQVDLFSMYRNFSTAVMQSCCNMLMSLCSGEIKSVYQNVYLGILFWMSPDSSCIDTLFEIFQSHDVSMDICNKSPVLLRIIQTVKAEISSISQEIQHFLEVTRKSIFCK